MPLSPLAPPSVRAFFLVYQAGESRCRGPTFPPTIARSAFTRPTVLVASFLGAPEEGPLLIPSEPGDCEEQCLASRTGFAK
jgi:hypothetical protein